MIGKCRHLDRRTILRGTCHGAVVTLGIPLLDLFLDGNGQALANGAPLPTRFATYFWGLGLTPTRWQPTTSGRNYAMPPQLSFLNGSLRDKTTVFSGFEINLDGNPALPHWTGLAAILTGQCPTVINRFDRLPSFDTAIADTIGRGTRFHSIECTPYRGAVASYSTRGQDSFATSDDSPQSLYLRLFGPGFHDPNSTEWRPDPQILVRKSVLSSVAEQRAALLAEAGAEDRARLDQYFTALREVENRLDTELTKPARAEACIVPDKPANHPHRVDSDTVSANNSVMARLCAMALACNQTRVLSYQFTPATSEIYRPGESTVYHARSHEEPIDPALGYQPISSQLADISIAGLATFLRELEAIREGDGSLLDHALVLGFSDTGWAKVHSLDNIPMLLVGGANGKHLGGTHCRASGDPVTRVALTVQQMMGVPIRSFGGRNMTATRPITEIMG